MDRVPLYQVDAFTGTRFRGNPAAVCLLPAPLEDALLQAIAAEMNLSETAFLERTSRRRWAAGDVFSLRWFTPRTEVRLCGHATLASAAVLFDVVGVQSSEVTFETLSGDLRARRAESGIALDFPLDPPQTCEVPHGIVEALGLSPDAVTAAACGRRTHKLLLELSQASTLRALTPDFPALLRSEEAKTYRGLVVTAAGGEDYDFISRYFAPWVGINEDPVTGSAHTVLGPYWAERLGKSHLHAYQASERGGELWVKLLEGARVELVGEATLVFEGYLSVPGSGQVPSSH
ncbi:MAG: PhzF family phenazine biosynthesis protein [Anaerolineae bacterium]